MKQFSPMIHRLARHIATRNLSPTVSLILLIVMAGAVSMRRGNSSASPQTEIGYTAVAAAPHHVVDPAKVEGHRLCVDCHQAEVNAWLQSKHATVAFDELQTSPSSLEYAKKLGIERKDIVRRSVCIKCHATPQRDHRGHVRVLSGISCEACHGGSGGDDGWLNRHAVYGSAGTSREQESRDHFQNRQEACRNAGQLGTDNVYELARQCLACHIVDEEKLVNVAGHKTGDSNGYEFVAWSLGEVRHNLHFNQHHNAVASTLWMDPLWRHGAPAGTPAERIRLMYLAGFLADLEVSLRNRGKATEQGEYADAMGARIETARDELQAIVDEIGVELSAIQEAVDVVESIIEENLEEVNPEDRDLYTDAADKVQAAAGQFIVEHNGSQLGGLDEYGLPEIPDEARGPVYQPQQGLRR